MRCKDSSIHTGGVRDEAQRVGPYAVQQLNEHEHQIRQEIEKNAARVRLLQYLLHDGPRGVYASQITKRDRDREREKRGQVTGVDAIEASCGAGLEGRPIDREPRGKQLCA
jgi:hypothetical protein